MRSMKKITTRIFRKYNITEDDLELLIKLINTYQTMRKNLDGEMFDRVWRATGDYMATTIIKRW